MNVQIRPETAGDHSAIWQFNQSAFGSDAEANLVDALRDGGFSTLSLVAVAANEVVGHILFSRLSIIGRDAKPTAAVSLAPMSVLPNFQRRGIGDQLVRAGLDSCHLQGHRIAVVLGHPAYYPRFGFSKELARALDSPFGGGEAWMALEFSPGALKGVAGRVAYPPPFGILE